MKNVIRVLIKEKCDINAKNMNMVQKSINKVWINKTKVLRYEKYNNIKNIIKI